MYLWEIFRGFEENLANRTNWIIIREFRINMRNICHFQSLLASQLPHWPSAPPWCSCCFHESQMQSEQETVDVWYRFNESLFKTQAHDCDVNLTFFFCPILQQVRGWKAVCEQKPTLFAGDRSLISLSTWTTSKSSSFVTWLIRELSFFARAPAVPTPPVPAASAAVSRLGTPRHAPAAVQPALPSVLCRSEPSPHSELTPELPVTLAWRLSSTSQNFNHGEFNSDRIK